MLKYTIVIEDISEGDQHGYLARILGSKYELAEAMADTIPELLESIKLTMEAIEK